MNKPYILAIEGHDYSGKTSVAKALTNALREWGINAVYLKAPDYSSESGRLVTSYLNGNIPVSDPLAIAAIYALNRGNAYRELMSGHKNTKGLVIIADRSLASNVCTLPSLEFLKGDHGEFVKGDVVGNLSKYSMRAKFIEKEAGSFFPSHTLVLHAGNEVVAKRMRMRDVSDSVADDGGSDIHENLDAVTKTRALYDIYSYQNYLSRISTEGADASLVAAHIASWFSDFETSGSVDIPKETFYSERPDFEGLLCLK